MTSLPRTGMKGLIQVPRVKVVWCEELYENDYYDSYSSRQVIRDISPEEFETVSDEELDFLRKNLIYLFAKPKYPNWKPSLVVLDEEPILTKLDYIKTELKKHQEKLAEAAKKKQAKKLEKDKQTKAKKLAQFEQLKKELGK